MTFLVFRNTKAYNMADFNPNVKGSGGPRPSFLNNSSLSRKSFTANPNNQANSNLKPYNPNAKSSSDNRDAKLSNPNIRSATTFGGSAYGGYDGGQNQSGQNSTNNANKNTWTTASSQNSSRNSEKQSSGWQPTPEALAAHAQANPSANTYENNGPNYTHTQGDYNKNAGYRGRGANRGGQRNYGRTFDAHGRISNNYRDHFQNNGRGGRGSNFQGGRGQRGRGYNNSMAMPISRGGHHRRLVQENESSDKEQQNLPTYSEEDDLFRPKISERQQAFMERKAEGRKTAAQLALQKVKDRKMMWRSQRKIVEQKEKEKDEQREKEIHEQIEAVRKWQEADDPDQDEKIIGFEG